MERPVLNAIMDLFAYLWQFEIVLENRRHSVKSVGTLQWGSALPSALWQNRA